MRPTISVGLCLCCFLVVILGCGRTYQSITVDSPTQLSRHQEQRITIRGNPAASRRGDFVPPTPLRDGYWTLVVDKVRCIETVNFENEPRIRSLVRMAESASEAGHPITVSGKVHGAILKMESVEGVRTGTAWYKNKNPYYSYGEYYEWYPFAYNPNGRVHTARGIR